MKLFTAAGAVLDVVGKIVTGVILVWLLLTMLNLGFGGLTLINQIATALIGQGVLGFYGLAAGVTMLAMTGSKVWGMLEFSLGHVREDDTLSALGAIVGRGLRRGIGAFLEIVVGGIAWPIILLGWLGKRSDERDREKLAMVREYHSLRREIEQAQQLPEESHAGDASREDAPPS